MNLETMETALRRFGFDLADPLATWINAAMHDLEESFDWPWLESKIDDIEMPKGSATITLPESCLKIIFIRDATNERKLDYYDRHRFAREINEPKEEGQAEVYTLINTNEVQLWRVIQENITFEVMYQGKTNDLIEAPNEPTTGTSIWPSTTHYLIVLRAAAFALQAENEEERAKVALEQYEKSLLRLMGKYGERNLDEPETVQDVQGYGASLRRRWW